MNAMENYANLKNAFSRMYKGARSAWEIGVNGYAEELLDSYKESIEGGYATGNERGDELEKVLLNGALNWKQASEGGSFEICDESIAKRLCTPSELKKTRNGEKNPNSRETWLDVQTRALKQAANRVIRAKFAAERELAASLGG